jgi:hypothetical protein
MTQNLPARSGSATTRQGVTASLSDGVLTVTVPKSEDQEPHRVEVTSGSGTRQSRELRA